VTEKADLSVATLVAEALSHTDRGPADVPFTDNLELLVGSCLRTGRLNATGVQVLRKAALRHLRNLLDLQAYADADPAVASRDLGAPVVVTGLPRTGTTLLHNLLALDPSSRALRFWEALRPVPAATAAAAVPAEAVRAQAQRWLDAFYAMVPGFRAIHAATPDGPEECDALLQNSFASQHFDDMFDAGEYSRWLAGASLDREYRHYALQLRVLSGSSASYPRWTLKSPSHLSHLDALLDALPGATVVICHRDPREAVASYASLVHTLRTAYSDSVSPAEVGRQALTRAATAMQRAMAVRIRTDGSAFVDVSYRGLVDDPVRTVRHVYRGLGRPLAPGVEDAVRRWAVAHPAPRHGPHDYDLARFGLTTDDVDAAFAPYLGRFGPLVVDS